LSGECIILETSHYHQIKHLQHKHWNDQQPHNGCISNHKLVTANFNGHRQWFKGSLTTHLLSKITLYKGMTWLTENT